MSDLPTTSYFSIPQPFTVEVISEGALPPGWSLKPLPFRKERQVFYDTFEWQAFGKGFAVIRKKGRMYMVDLETGSESGPTELTGSASSFFPDSLPAGKIREQLRSCAGIRAYTRLCTVEVATHTFKILDDNDKTTGTVTAESWRLVEKNQLQPFAQFFSIQPYRGYGKEVHAVIRLLVQHHHAGKPLTYRELFLLLMDAASLKVRNYSAKIDLKLKAEATIHENARQLLQFTRNVMQQNEDGIRNDIDTEFLHDYRVAVRRTRSILKQLKGVFDPLETVYFLHAFRDLGQWTNELRDTDVYLLRKEVYMNYLPPVLRPALDLFFKEITDSRKSLHKQFSRHLESTAYRALMDEWETFLNRVELPESEQAPKASLTTRKIAVATISKSWKKAITHGRQVSPDTTDTELHALRIDCKKLRYLLEFFSSIFPHATVSRIIGQLKELQDNLGNFVDYSVQLDFLYQRLTALEHSGDIRLAAATGGLMATLYQHRESARRHFHQTFSEFDNEGTALLFNELITGSH